MNWWKKTTTFIKEVRAEMQKVSFPTWDDVVANSVVVLVTSVIFGVYLAAADTLIVKVYTWLFQRLG